MSENTNENPFNEQAAAFQKMWMDSMSKLGQTAFTFTPESPPEETIQEIRRGILKALAHSWEEFLRSPQFLESMKQWMDQAISFRTMTNDFLSKVRHESQEPTQRDIDSILQALRHLETRVLNRVEEVAEEVDSLKANLKNDGQRSSPATKKNTARAAARPPKSRSTSKRKRSR